MVKPAKRGRGRPPKCDPLNLPEFFKIYLPEHNSKQLVIPPDFVQTFSGRIPKSITLKIYKGKVWKVELDKSKNKLLMKKGWESFVIDNSLERGEFLTFAYEGKAVFTVKIFSISGCKKDELKVANDQPRVNVKVKQEPNLDQVFSHHADEKMHFKEVKAEQESLGLHEAMTKGIPDRTIESKSIKFTNVFNGKCYELHIPAAIFSKNNIETPKVKSPEMVLLRNQSGVTQKVKFKRRHDRNVLTSGWREFQLKNKLVKGDECEFEVILGKGRKIKEILLVQISRRAPALTRKDRSISSEA